MSNYISEKLLHLILCTNAPLILLVALGGISELVSIKAMLSLSRDD